MQQIDAQELEKAARLLQEGDVVAFPTETVYGLGAALFQERGVKKIFLVKGRPLDNPLIVHVAHRCEVKKIADSLPSVFYPLSEAFFPGPLTVIVPKAKSVPLLATAGLSSVAIRMPNHPIALDLIQMVGEPLVAPSANISGRPSATKVEHVLEDFMGKIPAVVRGDPSSLGIESTVVSLLGNTVEIVRPGTISEQQIQEVVGNKVQVRYRTDGRQGKILSPGMKYRHYAPHAKVFFFTQEDLLQKHYETGTIEKTLVLSNKDLPVLHRLQVDSTTLYAHFRLADQLQMERILILCDCHIYAQKGLMNRIEKACDGD